MMQALQIIDCEQNSEEWDAARLGVITSSAFKDVLAKGKSGNPSKTRLTYMRKLAGERITGNQADNYYNEHMERGHEQEDRAIELYEERTGNKVELVGFVKNEDGFGASPDRFMGDEGIAEVKTALAHIQIERLLSGGLPSTHKAQIQGQLYVTERKWTDFISYSPNMPLFIVRVEREEEYIAELKKELFKFEEDLQEMITTIKGLF